MIQKTQDYRRLHRIEHWEPLFISQDWIYLIEHREGLDLGFWGFEKNRDGYRIHAAMQYCKGKGAVESAKRSFSWIFENTEAKAIYAAIPEDNRAAAVVAVRSGMCYAKTEDKTRHYEVRKWEA
jgi:hypothetical protein